MRAPLRLAVVGTTCLLMIPALTGGAMLQCQEASPYLPLDDWTMPYVEHLIATRAIADPSPLTRPLRRADVVHALEAADPARLSFAAAATLHRLRAALGSEPRQPHFRVTGGVGAAAANYARRDPLAAIDSTGPRQAGSGHGTGHAELAFELAAGHVVATTHLQLDTRLKYDPDWFGKKDRAIAGRTAEAYVAAQWRLRGGLLRKPDPQWGPPRLPGLLPSPHP